MGWKSGFPNILRNSEQIKSPLIQEYLEDKEEVEVKFNRRGEREGLQER
jgi:hypothetical protein